MSITLTAQGDSAQILTNSNNGNVVLGPTGSAGAPIIATPADVTVGVITYRYVLNANSLFSGSRLKELELTVPYTYPVGWIGKGVHAYVEYPDQSASSSFSLNGTTALDGTTQIGGEWKPIDIGQISDDGSGFITITGLSAPTEQVKIRVYLTAFNDNSHPRLVRNTLAGASPSAVVTVDPPPVFALGEEYAKIVATIGASFVYGQNGSGQEVGMLTVFWTPPNDPAFAGVMIQMHRPSTVTAPPGTRSYVLQSNASDINSGIISGKAISSQWTKEIAAFPTTVERNQLWILSVDSEGNINSFVNGFTPSLTLTMAPPAVGGAGQEYAAVLPSFTAAVVYGVSVDGAETYGFSGTATMPADAALGGYQVYIHNTADGTNHANDYPITGGLSPNDTTWHTDLWPIQGPQPTWDIYALSYNANNQQNTFVLGTTPRIAGLNPTVQTSGSLRGNRLDPGTLDASMDIIAARLAIANLGVITSKIASAAVIEANIAALNITTPLIAAANITTAKIANAAITRALIANLAVGTAQIDNLAVTDAKINDLTASKITAGTITASVSMTAPTLTITNAGLTVNIDSTNYMKVSSAVGQSQVLDLTIRTQNAANNRFVQLSSGGQITGQSVGAITFSLDGNGGLNLAGNQVVGVRRTGWVLPTGTVSRATFDQSTVTLAGLAQVVAALVTDMFSAHGLIGT